MNLKDTIEIMFDDENIEIYSEHNIPENSKIFSGMICDIPKNMIEEYSEYYVSHIGLNENTKSITLLICHLFYK